MEPQEEEYYISILQVKVLYYVPTSAVGAALAICLCRGAGEAGADTTTNESVRLVSDLLVRSPPS